MNTMPEPIADPAGAEFHQVRQKTWTRRFHGANWSQGTLNEAAVL